MKVYPLFVNQLLQTIRFGDFPSLLKQQFQYDFHDQMHQWKAFRISILVMSYDWAGIFLFLSKHAPLSFNFIYGSREESQR
jgi:hypothetical protein